MDLRRRQGLTARAVAIEEVYQEFGFGESRPQALKEFLAYAYHFPYFNSLAEEQLKVEGRGAIAAFSPSGLSLNRPAHLFHRALLLDLKLR